MQLKTERVVIGSVADISARYENGKPITVILILEFSTDLFTKDPELFSCACSGEPGQHSSNWQTVTVKPNAAQRSM
jgi:hypothetical protein